MSTPVLTFFNNKGGVGKTSLVFHLAWMFSEMGKRVVTIDLDPQANLTSAFLAEEALEELWDPQVPPKLGTTIFRCIQPLTKVGDIQAPVLQTTSKLSSPQSPMAARRVTRSATCSLCTPSPACLQG